MKHKHAEIIKAWVDNLELTAFCKSEKGWAELKATFDGIPWDNNREYFLCLPQHKDACLHWLNGGKSELKLAKSCGAEWATIARDTFEWTKYHCLMMDNLESRIKPKKENRWIAVRKIDHFVRWEAYESEAEAVNAVNPDFWQIIEIEVEVG